MVVKESKQVVRLVLLLANYFQWELKLQKKKKKIGGKRKNKKKNNKTKKKKENNLLKPLGIEIT